MAASTYFAQVQQLYIAYFGRPADPTGQEYWAKNIDAANGSIASVIAGFSASAESAALFGNKSSIDKVTAIYQNAFGRAPEPAGLAYWVAQLDSGKVSQAQASWTIQQSAGPGDAAAVQNKLTAAQAFTAQIDTTAEIQGYQGSAAADSARAFLKTVTADNATATAAVNGAAAAVAAATSVGVVGTTFTLTTGIDNLVGDGGNNVFTGDNTGTTATVTAGDQINGGAGTDTFNYFVATAGGAVAAPQLTAVENVNLVGTTTAAITADLSSAVGLQQVALKNTTTTGSTITVGTGVAVGLDNVKAAAGTETFKVSAAQTAATLNVLNGSNVGTVNVDNVGTATALTTLNVVSAAGAANTIGSLQSTGTETTLNVSGAGDLTIGGVGASLTTINASAATGKTVINAAGTGNITYTGGTGNDTIKFGATELAKTDVLDGGAGTDTLVINDTALALVYDGINAAKNFEVLGLGQTVGTTVVDRALITNGIDAFAIGQGVTATVSNSLSTTKYAVDLGVNNAGTLTVANKVGEQKVTVDLTNTDTAAAHSLASLVLTGAPTVALSSNGASGNVITALTNTENSTITITGSADLTIGNVAGTQKLVAAATGSKVDASAFTGKLTVTGSDKSDVLIGGSNDDVLITGKGADILTGGAGKDTFVVKASVFGASKDITTITDFVKGTDKLTVAASTTDVTKVAVTEVTLAAALDQIAAKATAVTTAAWGVFEGNTYVVVDADGALDATSVVVKLAGTVDLGTTATVGAVFA